MTANIDLDDLELKVFSVLFLVVKLQRCINEDLLQCQRKACIDNFLFVYCTMKHRTLFLFQCVGNKTNSWFNYFYLLSGDGKKVFVSCTLMSVNWQVSLECCTIERSQARRHQRSESCQAKLVSGHNDRAKSIKLPLGACLFYSLTPEWMEMQLEVFTEEQPGL